MQPGLPHLLSPQLPGNDVLLLPAVRLAVPGSPPAAGPVPSALPPPPHLSDRPDSRPHQADHETLQTV